MKKDENKQVLNSPDNAVLTANKQRKGVGKPFTGASDPRRNNNGRPVGSRSISTVLREALQELARSKDGKEKTHERLLVERILERAIVKGEFKFAELIIDRMEGKAPQTIDLNAKVQDVTLTDAEKKALLGLLKP